MDLILFFDKLNKIPLYLLLFLIPIFFLPLTQNVLDFPKQILALILIFLSLIGWLGKKIFEGGLVLRGNKIFYLAFFLIFFSFLFSSIFSLSLKTSFFGYPLDITDSFLTFLLFLILVFLVINSFKEETEFLPFLFLFLLSAAIAGILNILQLYGIFPFPFDFTKTLSFNTVGTTNALALFGAALLPISLVLTFISKGFLKIILGIISFILIGNVILVNFKTAWVVLIVGILVLFIFGFGNQKKKITAGWAILLMAGLILSVFFYFFPVHLPGFPVLPPEVSLSFNSEIYILKGAFGEGIKNIILGTGPGTFIFNYSKYRSPLLNQTLFWGTRFSDGNSSFSDWILTKGILMGITLLFLYFLIIYFIFRYLEKTEVKNFYEIKLGLSAGILGLICASFIYPFNFVLYFTFWFLVAGFILFFSPKLRQINLSSPLRMVSANLILVVVIIFSLSLFFLQGQKYFAEMKYLKGIEASQVGNFDRAINYIQVAGNLNPSLDIYWRDLSQLFLVKANLISQDPNLSSEEKRRLANLAIVNGAEAINQAINVAPMNVANWNVRGFFYRNLIGIEGAGDLSLSSYQKAIQLEPASPFVFGEKGRVYILIAQDFAQKGEDELRIKNLDLALENLRAAIELKSDYAPAHYLLAVAYDQQGKLDEAISKLEETKMISPQDPGVAFQLGLLYWREEKTKEAQVEFERAVNLNPNYSNARYMLGLVYDKRGEEEKAKHEFETLVVLNPQNQEIKKILENLEKGLPALEGVTLSQPPIQETPPEIEIQK
ncbi:MAG: tetratricopeptide repeat protein [Candidatus Nealsonbacteria bacterium]|nr:tetratricopeptide repeat protein [Candidatus Nealsonbacteria bacterium]